MPPEFEKLPKPKTTIKNEDNNDIEINLKEILTKKNSTSDAASVSETSNGSLEKSIIERIKSN